jgi:hypothetical protein
MISNREERRFPSGELKLLPWSGVRCPALLASKKSLIPLPQSSRSGHLLLSSGKPPPITRVTQVFWSAALLRRFFSAHEKREGTRKISEVDLFFVSSVCFVGRSHLHRTYHAT